MKLHSREATSAKAAAEERERLGALMREGAGLAGTFEPRDALKAVG